MRFLPFAALPLAALMAACSGKTATPDKATRPLTDARPLDAAASAEAPTALPDAFARSLVAARARFEPPARYHQVPAVDNPHWKYDLALRADDDASEIRIRIDPLAPALAEAARCKADPSCTGTDPNQRWNAWLFAIAANIGGARADK